MIGKLFIILPTYNGAKHLPEQIESIQEQTFRDWHLLMRDDGSSDRTREILVQLTSIDDRIELLEDTQGNLGPAGSFSWLMRQALHRGADYLAFSDQDDIWLPNKLATTMSRMKQVEKQQVMNTPVLVHTDVEIVNESLETLSPSFMHYENIENPDQVSINTLLIQNHVVGCTMLCNRFLLDQASPIPSSVRMHDWWLAAYSVVAGVLSYVPVATVRYRQHGSNVLGAGGFSHVFNPFSSAWLMRVKKRPELQRSTVRLTTALLERASDLPETTQKELLLRCQACLRRRLGPIRIHCAYRLGMKGQNWASSFLFFSLLLVSRF